MNEKLLEKEFRPILTQALLKTTPARLAILHVLKTATSPISIEDISKKLHGTIDQATIYRSVTQFLENNIIRTVDLRHNHAHYELATENHHHHVICKICDKVADIPYCDIEPLLTKAKRKSNFATITAHSLELYGICNSCAIKKTPR